MSAKAIYVHIPFCNNICAYCDFTKFLYHPNYVYPYIEQLIKQIEEKETIDVNSIYIGGGTPSSLPLNLLEKVLISLEKFTHKIKEFTIETNVENINQQFIDLIKKYKVNRLSIGVQTFNDRHLQSIKRKHTFLDINKKIKLLKDNNFENVSIDLIYGLPNQTLEEWKDDLEKAISLDVKHISLYSLMIEENTIFYLNKVKEKDEDFLEECYNYALSYLKENGFNRYEVSNFAKSPDYESKHNLVYWFDEEYIAFGVGASGYENNIRYTYTKSLQKYIADFNFRDEEIINEYNHKEEFIMLHLRTRYGLSISKYNQIFNSNFINEYENALNKLLKMGNIEIKNDTIYVKEDKVYILNQIILELISCIKKEDYDG